MSGCPSSPQRSIRLAIEADDQPGDERGDEHAGDVDGDVDEVVEPLKLPVAERVGRATLCSSARMGECIGAS